MAIRLYCISGLGADQRAFQYIDFTGYDVVHMDYISPIKGETLPEYAQRMVDHYQVERGAWLLGVSFGGMVAQEMAKITSPDRLIGVATILDRREIRGIFRFLGRIRIDRLISPKLLVTFGWLTQWIFGVESKRERSLLYEILGDTDPAFIPWAVGAVFRWEPPGVEVPVTRIHGTADRLFPIKRTYGVTHPIKGSGHLTIVGYAEQVSEVLAELIANAAKATSRPKEA